MESSYAHSLIRKIGLGTVQFGLDYGISNSTGKTSKDQVNSILEFAKSLSLETLDTAEAYGNSEEVLGGFNLDPFNLVTKFSKQVSNDSLSLSLQGSLSRMKLGKVYGYIAHTPQTLIENPFLWEQLSDLKREGKTKKIGYSIYSPNELERLLDLGMIPDLVQLPFNLFDQRFLPHLSYLKSINVEIHSRSAFLQGLFFMNPKELDPFFNSVKPSLAEIQERYPVNEDRAAMLLIFCLEQENIDKVVIGVNSLEQLKGNLSGLNSFVSAGTFSGFETSESICNPSNWPNL